MGRRDLFNLDGRVAFITGATSGIGRAMAQALWEYGCELILTTLPTDDVDATIRYIKSASEDIDSDSIDDGPQISTFECNFLDVKIEDVEEQIFFKALSLSSTGVIDFFLGNAGISASGSAEKISDKDFDKVIHLNMNIPMKLTRVFGKFLIENELKGKIVLTGSLCSHIAFPDGSAYTVSKHGLLGFVRSCACEWSSKGINVNCICPGFIETALTAPIAGDSGASDFVTGRVPIKRWGCPNDFKGIAVYLCSSASDFVCGESIALDGGWLAT